MQQHYLVLFVAINIAVNGGDCVEEIKGYDGKDDYDLKVGFKDNHHYEDLKKDLDSIGEGGSYYLGEYKKDSYHGIKKDDYGPYKKEDYGSYKKEDDKGYGYDRLIDKYKTYEPAKSYDVHKSYEDDKLEPYKVDQHKGASIYQMPNHEYDHKDSGHESPKYEEHYHHHQGGEEYGRGYDSHHQDPYGDGINLAIISHKSISTMPHHSKHGDSSKPTVVDVDYGIAPIVMKLKSRSSPLIAKHSHQGDHGSYRKTHSHVSWIALSFLVSIKVYLVTRTMFTSWCTW